MNTWIRRAFAALTAIVLAASVAACSGQSEDTPSASSTADKDSVITVIAASNQWGSLAKELGGSYVDVTSILNNTSTDAHDYEPTSNDISKFQHAQVAIVNGAGYDEWAVKAAEQSKAIVIDAANEGGKKTGDNPHVWFSSDVRVKTADAITAAYEKIMPEHKAQFQELNEKWQAAEDKLEEQLATVAQADDAMPYAATESVGEYLADDMGLKDVTPKGYKQAAANESEPTPSDIKQFTDLLRSDYSDEELADLTAQGVRSILRQVPELGILHTARDNAAAILIPMFSALGFDEEAILITFRKEFTEKDLPFYVDKLRD